MKKAIIGLVLLVVLIIAGAAYYVLTNLDELVKAAIEKYGSQTTQTAVRVEQVNIDLTQGSGAIRGLTIANPTGFSTPYIFSMGEISSKIDINSLRQPPYVIDEITVRGMQVFAEINKNNKTNLNELKKNLPVVKQKSKAKQSSKSTAEKSDDNSVKEPRLIIHHVLFTDGTIQVKVTSLNNKEYQLKLPTLTMSNLGGKQGATPNELANEILNRITDAAQKEIKKQVLDKELDKLKAEASVRLEQEQAKLKSQTDKKLEEEKQKAEEKLKGMFGQ